MTRHATAMVMSALILFLAIVPASADIVRLKIGRDLFGQGWMFLDIDGACKIATAAHVVRGQDGSVRLPLAVDGRGREWPATRVLAESTEPDIAVLAVPSANNPAACGDGRLSSIGVERRAAAMEQAVIVTTGQSEVIELPVVRHASAMDAGRGELFTVRPVLGSERVMKGWSGSVVRDVAGPLGIVFGVDPEHNEAFVVRVDAIRRLMAGAAPAPATTGIKAVRPSIGVLAGTTDDTEHGPDHVLDAGWSVMPVRRTVVFVATFPSPTPIQRVNLATAGDNQLESVSVATQAEGSDTWVDAASCRPAGGNTVTVCSFLRRTVARVRFVVRATVDATVTLNGLALQ